MSFLYLGLSHGGGDHRGSLESLATALSQRDLLLRAKELSNLQGGSQRTVPGRKGMVWVEEDCVDEDATSQRDDDPIPQSDPSIEQYFMNRRRFKLADRTIDVEFWMTLARGMLAIALGLLLIVSPNRSDHMLGNFIGGFWIGVGIISIRWAAIDDRSRALSLATGAAAILAGGLVYSRGFLRHWIPDDTIMTLLGAVAILTSLLHFSGYLTVSRVHDRNTKRSRMLLGTFEAGLGLVILLQGRGELMYEVMAAWALVGGIVLLGDSLWMARQDRLASVEDEDLHRGDRSPP